MAEAQYAPQAQVPPEELPKADLYARQQQTGVRDVIWAIFFVATIGMLIALAAIYGDNFHTTAADRNGVPLHNPTQNTFGILAVSAGIGALVSIVWLFLWQRFTAALIIPALILEVAVLIAAGVLHIVWDAEVFGIILLVAAGLSLLLLKYIRNRVPFSAATMSSSAQALRDFKGPVILAYFMSILEGAFLVFWSYLLVCLAVEAMTTHTRLGRFLIFLVVFGMYWVSNVIYDICTVTTAGTVASWWFVPDVPSPTGRAFGRALTTNFGSICLGALIQPIPRVIEFILLTQRHTFCASCALPLLVCIDSVVAFFNFFGYVHVAMYGKNFTTGSQDTWRLLKSRGFDLLTNMDLAYLTTIIVSTLAGALASLMGIIWSHYVLTFDWDSWSVVPFFIAYFASQVSLVGVMQASVATTLVCWAEGPNTMAVSRPAQYNKLGTAAREVGANV